MSEKSTKVPVGMSFPSALLLAIIILRLTGYIDWSWWWILSPFWVGGGILVLFVLFITIFRRKL